MIVGNESDLKKKIENSAFILVRAINDSELKQLLKDGPESFVMHPGTRYENYYGMYVRECAKERTGTIVVCSSIGPFDKRFEILSTTGAYKCLQSVRTCVDVFNIYEANLNLVRTEEKPINRVVKSFLSKNNIYN